MNNLMCYIDPATTAIIWQIVAGVLISLSVVLGIWWTKISTFFKGLWVKWFKKDKKGEPVETEKVVDEELEELKEEETTEEKGE